MCLGVVHVCMCVCVCVCPAVCMPGWGSHSLLMASKSRHNECGNWHLLELDQGAMMGLSVQQSEGAQGKVEIGSCRS